MKYVEVVIGAKSAEKVSGIAKKFEVSDFRSVAASDDGMLLMRLLVPDNKLQPVLDALQHLHDKELEPRIVVLPVEIELPMPTEEERREEDQATTARESLYEEVEKNAQLNLNFILLVSLSTIVAAIGLINNNVAVIIGAMVIAPLLGPNLAFGLGTALGDIDLMKKSALTNSVGILLAIFLSLLTGLFWKLDYLNPEILSRTHVGIDAIVLALASGVAAALSLTTGLSSVLVGVMVAVALLPQAVTFGLMLGQGDEKHAISAGLVLVINLVCINLASKLVFFFKGIRPLKWWEKKKAERALVIYVLVWLVTLGILVFFIYSHKLLLS